MENPLAWLKPFVFQPLTSLPSSPPLLPQVPQVSSGEARRRTEPSAPPREGGPSQGTQGRAREMASAVEEEGPEIPSSTVHAFPVQAGPAREGGERTYQYWPFATSDLYNWKTQTPSFSEKPQGLIDLLESILFTHNPNCYRYFLLQKSTNGSCQKPGKMCQGWMGGPQYSLTSLKRGSPWCDPTGTSNALKVRSVSKCTVRLSWLALERPPKSQLNWPK